MFYKLVSCYFEYDIGRNFNLQLSFVSLYWEAPTVCIRNTIYIFFISFVRSLTSVHLLIVDVEGHCCTCLHSSTQTHTVGLLEERSACHLDPYLTTHNTLQRQVVISVAGFEPSVPARTDLRPRSHGDLRVCLLYLYFVPAIASFAGSSRFCAVCRIQQMAAVSLEYLSCTLGFPPYQGSMRLWDRRVFLCISVRTCNTAFPRSTFDVSGAVLW